MLLDSLRDMNPAGFILNPIKEAFINAKGLSHSLQILTAVGYLILFGLLLITLLLELFGQNLASVTYTSLDDTWQISYLALFISSGGFVIGWAYLLTGATDFSRRIFLPIMGVFAIQLLLIMPIGGSATIFAFCFAGLFLFSLIGLHLFTSSSRYWRDLPLVEFGLILAALTISMVAFWALNTSDARIATGLNTAFSILLIITLLFWFGSGLTIMNAAVSLAQRVIIILRYLFTEPVLQAIVVLVVLVRPVGTLMGIILVPVSNVQLGVGLLLDVCVSAPLPFVLLGLALTKRWTTAYLLPILALSLATPLFTLGLSVALYSNIDLTDRVELALGGLGLLPPLLLFVALMTYNVMSSGTTFANQEGELMPRSGRVLVLFGSAILITSFTLFYVNVQNPDTAEPNSLVQNLTNNAFLLSLILVSLPYLGWIVWRRRERLVGEDDTFLNIVPLLHRVEGVVPGRVWLIIAIILAGLCTCSICSVGMLLTP